MVVDVQVEDRPVVIERKEYIKEHHPYEKQYRVETKCALCAYACVLDPQGS